MVTSRTHHQSISYQTPVAPIPCPSTSPCPLARHIGDSSPQHQPPCRCSKVMQSMVVHLHRYIIPRFTLKLPLPRYLPFPKPSISQVDTEGARPPAHRVLARHCPQGCGDTPLHAAFIRPLCHAHQLPGRCHVGSIPPRWPWLCVTPRHIHCPQPGEHPQIHIQFWTGVGTVLLSRLWPCHITWSPCPNYRRASTPFAGDPWLHPRIC
jgi:hypothetical protein